MHIAKILLQAGSVMSQIKSHVNYSSKFSAQKKLIKLF